MGNFYLYISMGMMTMSTREAEWVVNMEHMWLLKFSTIAGKNFPGSFVTGGSESPTLPLQNTLMLTWKQRYANVHSPLYKAHMAITYSINLCYDKC